MAGMEIATYLGGAKHDSFISILFLLASGNTLSFLRLATVANIHVEISILIMTSITLNL